MRPVKVNADYRVTIPKEIREQFKLKPGQKIRLEVRNGIISLTPLKEEQRLKKMGL